MDEPTEPLLGALKVLPPNLASAVSIERFRREIHLAGRLQHPHIVPVLSAGQAGVRAGAHRGRAVGAKRAEALGVERHA